MRDYPGGATMVSVRLAFLGLALLTLTGCLHTAIGGHVVAQDYRGDPKRVLVLTEIDTRPGAVDVGYALKLELTRCEIVSLVAEVGGLALDAPAKLNATIATFRPDMILNLHLVSGLVQMGGPVLNKYLLTATDVTQKHEVWKGVVSWFASRVRRRSEIASDLATKIVKQMADDGILKSCAGHVGMPL